MMQHFIAWQTGNEAGKVVPVAIERDHMKQGDRCAGDTRCSQLPVLDYLFGKQVLAVYCNGKDQQKLVVYDDWTVQTLEGWPQSRRLGVLQATLDGRPVRPNRAMFV